MSSLLNFHDDNNVDRTSREPTAVLSPGSIDGKHSKNRLMIKLAHLHTADFSPDGEGRLLRLISRIAAACAASLTFDALAKLYPDALWFKNNGRSNAHMDVYTASVPSHLSDDDVIHRMEARVSAEDESVKMLSMHLDDVALAKGVLEKQYGELRMQLPHARAPRELAFWVSRQPWGELRFGRMLDRPDLLKSVVFDAGKSAGRAATLVG